jgi:hypothetical protein
MRVNPDAARLLITVPIGCRSLQQLLCGRVGELNTGTRTLLVHQTYVFDEQQIVLGVDTKAADFGAAAVS